MHEIFEQIDAYLAVLYEVREILLKNGNETSATRTRSREKANSKKTRIQIRATAGKINGVCSGVRQVGPAARAISTVLPQPPSRDVVHSEPESMVSSVEQKAGGEIAKRVPAVSLAPYAIKA